MKLERLTGVIIAIVIIGALLYLGLRIALQVKTGHLLGIQRAGAQKLQERYSVALAKENDSNKLTKQGVLLLKGNLLTDAVANLTRATEVDPKYKDAWFWLGYAYYKEKDVSKAISALNKVKEIDPLDPRAYQLLKITYDANGDKELAQNAQEKFEKLDALVVK